MLSAWVKEEMQIMLRLIVDINAVMLRFKNSSCNTQHQPHRLIPMVKVRQCARGDKLSSAEGVCTCKLSGFI